MPTISFAYKDFESLLGKKLPMDKFEDLLLLYAKAEVDKYDKKTDEVTIELDDTNLPYLWCPEGLARYFKGILGMRKGTVKPKTKKGNYKIMVDSSVKTVRPFITAFVAKGKKIDDYLLKQLVQFQEKFCEGYGRRRQKVSIGLYSNKRIKFPVHYKAVVPGSTRFVPLDFKKEMNLKEILAEHPKGQQYGWILEKLSKYPLLVDDVGEILSFPPIINSNFTGKLEVGDDEILFEATGDDESSLNLAANIFSQNMEERGFTISSVNINYTGRTIITPLVDNERIKISSEEVEELTGLDLTHNKIKLLLEKAGYDTKGGEVVVPHYRDDIMHKFDVIEDVAIVYGFDKIKDEPLSSYTVGSKESIVAPINSLRKAIIGMGFQEIFSHVLADKNSFVDNGELIELKNIMSETYSVVRNSLLPQLLDVLSKNKHEEYPQRVFEQGIIASRKNNGINERQSIALVSSHANTDFTEQKQYLSAILGYFGVVFKITPVEHPLFMKGRTGGVIVNGQSVGIVGELNPVVLSKLGIEMPTTALELDLNASLNL
jgi:phenylalanyl-tRNA synthetase beta chain